MKRDKATPDAKDATGSGRTFNRVLLNVAFSAALLLIGNGLLLNHNMARLDEHRALELTVNRFMAGLETLNGKLRRTEAAQRNYLLTGDEAYLSEYNGLIQQLPAEIPTLRRTMTPDEVREALLDELQSAVSSRLERLETGIELFRSTGVEAARRYVGSAQGREAKARIDGLLSRIRERCEVILQERSADAARSERTLRLSFYFSTLVNIVLLAVGFLLLGRYLRNQRRENWLKTAQAELSQRMQGDIPRPILCRTVLEEFARHLPVHMGAFYVREHGELLLTAGYGAPAERLEEKLALGERLVGQTAREGKVRLVTRIPPDYSRAISSSLGAGQPSELLFVPAVHEGEVLGILELATFGSFAEEDLELVSRSCTSIGAALNGASNRLRLQELLATTQKQASDLQTQQEELRTSNEELEQQTEALQQAKTQLQHQQEELQAANEELEQQTQALQLQKAELSRRNDELRDAKEELEAKAAQLQKTSQYKSEFLANMSHELRTPLNSILILSTLLKENKAENLTEEQIEFSRTIHSAGQDLLSIINDILDLSKVEAGKLKLQVDRFALEDLLAEIRNKFQPQANQKGLKLETRRTDNAPAALSTDRQRLTQVLRNFLSNALKFTTEGEVTLEVSAVEEDQVAFSVVDTGVGVPKDQLERIFNAFEQLDSSPTRRFGGTGLGLTISRELARLLRGRIEVESTPGKGSRFTLIIPSQLTLAEDSPLSEDIGPKGAPKPQPETVFVPLPSEEKSGDGAREDKTAPAKAPLDLPEVKEGDKVVLVVEDDSEFASTLQKVAEDFGFRAVVAPSAEQALALTEKIPVQGILLDIRLPDASGLSVLERLKNDLHTRHIPVHVISGYDYAQSALRLGAAGYLLKPVDREDLKAAFGRIEKFLQRGVRQVLIVEDDPTQRASIMKLLEGEDIHCVGAGTASEALELLKKETFDCMILDLRLPDLSGFQMLEQIEQSGTPCPPVVVYTGKDLTPREEQRLRKYSDSIIIKGARSPERLLDEVSLFLHRLEQHLPGEKRRLLRKLRQSSREFEGREVLVVDDDLRNVFALVSALESRGLKVKVARNGQEAIDVLEKQGRADLVLMDIMMPVMDGFEATRRIRSEQKFKSLPVIALTAKAMKGDYEKCLQAGASDYLPKPVNLERLYSLLRVWLPPRDVTFH